MTILRHTRKFADVLNLLLEDEKLSFALFQFTLKHSLPLTALLSMTANGYGSTRGFDELTTSPAKVVNEFRRYRKFSAV